MNDYSVFFNFIHSLREPNLIVDKAYITLLIKEFKNRFMPIKYLLSASVANSIQYIDTSYEVDLISM